MPGKLIFIFMLILTSGGVNGQTKAFTIKVAGIKIGRLEAYHIKNSNFDYYVTHSTVNFSILLKLKADIKTESLYHEGVLLKATVNSSLNGIAYSSKTIWKKDHYDIDCRTYKYVYKDTTLTKHIKWSAGKLYFEIPEAGDEVYTESYGKLGVLQKIGKSALKMTSPQSKQIYYYTADYSKLLKIEVVNGVKNFEMYPDSIK